MKLTKSNINILLILAGLAIGFLAWQWVAVPQMDKTAALETENVTLKTQVEMYQAVNANLEQYKTEMAKMDTDIAQIGEAYPVNIIREDEIMYLVNMENAHPDDLLINGIEMTSFMEVETDKAGTEVEGAEIVHLYQQPTSYKFKATYDGLKDMVNYLATTSNKKSIDVMEIERDDENGQLVGTFLISQYYMTGLDKEYQQLRIPTMKKGLPNVFHTVDGISIKSTDVNLDTEEGDVETEEEAEEAEEAEE